MCAAVYYAYVARRQWDVMSQQVDLMRDNQRPWLGISRIEKIVPTTRTFNPDSINILVEGSYGVRNFSNSPAFAVNVIVVPHASVERTRPPDDLIFCPMRDTVQGAGEVLFPGTETNFPTSDQLSIRKKDGHRSFWLLGCITYRDSSRKVHRTRFWLRTSIPIDSSPAFESWGQEAD